MNISRTAQYGLLAVAYVAQHSKDGHVTISNIAKEYDIPVGYLTKVTKFLVRADILNSKQGPTGGHTLSRPANEISLLEIIEAIDGPLDMTRDISELTSFAPFVKNMVTICEDGTAKVKDILHKAKLSEMIED